MNLKKQSKKRVRGYLREKFGEYIDLMECPRCGEFLRSTRRKCPYCGLVLITTNDKPEQALFSSTERFLKREDFVSQNIDESKVPLSGEMPLQNGAKNDFFSHRGAAPDGDTFSSKNRIAANDGYTQQRAHRNSEQEFTGESERKEDDCEIYSSKRKKAVAEDIVRPKIYINNDKEYYSPSLSKPDLRTNANADHDPEKNPYSGKNFMNTPPEKNEHSEEYSAKTILEFTRHRFASNTAVLVEVFMAALVLVSLLDLGVSLIIDRERVTVLITLIYIFLICIFSFAAIKTFNRKFTHVISVLTIIYSIAMLVMLKALKQEARAPEILIFFIPVCGLDILCFHLTKTMSGFYNIWDAYHKRGSELVELPESEDIEFYNSKSNENDESGEEEQPHEE